MVISVEHSPEITSSQEHTREKAAVYRVAVAINTKCNARDVLVTRNHLQDPNKKMPECCTSDSIRNACSINIHTHLIKSDTHVDPPTLSIISFRVK